MADGDQNVSNRRRAGGKETSNQPLGMVGVGVSSDSLQSLQTLFANLSEELGAAYIVAVRQLEGLSVETVLDSLSRQCRLPVKVAKNGETIKANCVYVGGPNDTVILDDGKLRTRTATEPVGQRGTVDTMLISLAEQAQDRAVAVILAGLASDGTAGVTATKKFGGLSIGEVVPGQEEAGMQGASGPRGIVDLLLPIDRIAEEIALYVANLAIVDEAGPDELPEKHAPEIAQIATILRNVTGNDFHGYKRNTFFRRVQRRMQVVQVSEIDAYVRRLRDDRDEVQHLFQDLLIGVTHFFRDPHEFEVIERELPRLFEGKGPDDQFRVWVLGCATGEEAYSLAILLREYVETLEAPPFVQIFATDLDAKALGAARAGRYADSIAGHVRPDRLARWFVKEGATYCVAKELREMCIFSPHNVVKDAPFSRIDLLSCRNLLIYLNGDLQSRLIPIFHFSLRQGGVLFLGSSENVTRHQKLFAAVDRKNRVFRRLDTATRVLPDFPISPRVRPPGPQDANPAAKPRAGLLAGTVSRRAEIIAERYAPAYVIVDGQHEILHFSGRTGRYLEPTAGTASLNLLNLVDRELRLDLRSALHRAAAEGTRIEMPVVPMARDGLSYCVKIVVEPVGDDTAFVVLFQDAGTTAEGPSAGGERMVSDQLVQRLEAELRLTKERLQATIEELESTNEELKSSNEEYQSINEELQSANEELETSKEELQSVNEELQTVNGELAHRVGELGRSNSDLKNLLESTQIATLFLDNDLRVRNFTPAATDIFHLLESDVGRPIGHVASRISYVELERDVREVLKSLAPVEREVAGVDDRHFTVRVRPYRSVDNFIAGTVVTFVDVTERYRSDAALRESESRFRALTTAGGYAIYRMSPDWRTMYELDGNGFLVSASEPAANWLETYIVKEERPAVMATATAAIRTKSLFEVEHRVRRADGSEGWALSRAVPITDEQGEIVEWFGAATDVTERRAANERLRQNEERLRLIVDSARDYAIFTTDPNGIINSWYAGAQSVFGWSSQEAIGAGVDMTFTPDDRANGEPEKERATGIREGRAGNVRWHLRKDGAQVFIEGFAVPLKGNGGELTGFLKIGQDVTERRQALEHERTLLAELQHRVRNILAVIRAMVRRTHEEGQTAEEFIQHLHGRLDALARTQVLLTREVDAGVNLESLIRSELVAHAVDEDQVTISGPKVELTSKAAEVLTLAVHELMTNSVKYGALAHAGARIEIAWKVKRGEPRRVQLRWAEKGVPMVQPAPRREGFGTELITRRVAYELRGSGDLEIRAGGILCTLEFPLAGRPGVLQTDKQKRLVTR